jgi:hypothetical protein
MSKVTIVDPVPNTSDEESGELRQCHRFDDCGGFCREPSALCDQCQNIIDKLAEQQSVDENGTGQKGEAGG